ncbi:hypothetical protein [Achromobacter sp.]|uniref:hypothetical protein n=1 Tax=Achromobacter sp. TaxID=134375 RepID=UPI003C71C951
MKTLTTLFGACALSLGMTGAAYAQAAGNEHGTHQPAAAEPASQPQMAPGAGMMKNMDAHMQAMGGMHQKMAAAKTAEERQALMGEHMKSMRANGADMQGCREMMGSMMNPAGDAPSATSPAAKG